MTFAKVLNSNFFGLAKAIYNKNLSFAGFDYGYASTIAASQNPCLISKRNPQSKAKKNHSCPQ